MTQAVSATPEMAAALEERIVYMPWFSNPLNDYKIRAAYVLESPARSRKSVGLPVSRTGVVCAAMTFQEDPSVAVFACFSTSYKVGSLTANAWGRALARAGRGRLWVPRWRGLEQLPQRLAQ